jgi:integrase
MSSYLVKRADHYHYRRAIPAAWRGLLGQREWKQSLKCSTRAEALPKARALAVEHDKLIAELEAKGQEQVARDREQEIRQLYAQRRQDLFKWFQGTELSDADEQQLNAELAKLMRMERAQIRGLDVKHDPRAVALAFMKYGYECEFGPNIKPPNNEDERDEWEVEKLRLSQKIARLEPAQNKLTAVAADWHKFVGHSPETLRKHTAHLKRFTEVVGDLPIDKVSRDDVIRFRDDIVRSGAAAPTTQKYLDTLNALLRWAKRERQLLQVNPAEDIRPPRDTRPSDKKGRRPFSPNELRTILSEAKKQWSKSDRERDLLMMLRVLIYTGARPEEIAQLRPCDVRDGAIHINDEDGKLIKNTASIRIVPIHSAIIDFEDFARCGDALVFKTFECITDRKAEALSYRFTRLIRDRLKMSDQRKTLYSIRHSFADACRNARVPHGIQYQLMGHVESNANAAGYGTGASIETLREELERIYPLS